MKLKTDNLVGFILCHGLASLAFFPWFFSWTGVVALAVGRILLFIGEMVVTTMDCDPEGWRELQTTRSKDGKGVLKPKRTRKAAMRDEPMETKIDSKNAEHIHKRSASSHFSPGVLDSRPQQIRSGINANANAAAEVGPWPTLVGYRITWFGHISTASCYHFAGHRNYARTKHGAYMCAWWSSSRLLQSVWQSMPCLAT